MKKEYSNYQEYLRHPKFKLVRKQAMDRALYVCEDCKISKATEVHHLCYPKWGTFDIPENLVAICHSCHCIRHGVKN